MRKRCSFSSNGVLKKRRIDSSSFDLKRNRSMGGDMSSAFAFNKKRTKKSFTSSELSMFALQRPIAASSPSLTFPTPPVCSYQNEQFDDATNDTNTNDSFVSSSIIKPSTYMITTLHAQGYYVRSRLSLSMPDGFFDKITKEQISSYGQDIINAVRNRDVGTLRRMWKVDGRSLSCCNRFGESILHMSCRRGLTDVVQFLLDEVKLSLHVVDDCGRTPLHDSMWTCQPNFDIVEMIIRRAPELMFISDKRGNLPLDYVRQEQYDKWIRFIDRKNETLLPKTGRMKKLFVMAASSVQANNVNRLIRKNYIDVIRRSKKASSALLLQQQHCKQQTGDNSQVV